MSRAIQSAFLIFQPALQSATGPKTIVAVPDAQETSDDACDIGSDAHVLQSACQTRQWPLDLSLVKADWNVKAAGTRYSPSSKAIGRRARDLRLFLRQQAKSLMARGAHDVHIALVAHGGLLHYLTEDWEGAEQFPGTGWVNCETRAYTFAHGVEDDADGDDARLVELMSSRRARGLAHAMLPREKQAELYHRAMQAWEDQGLQNHSKAGLEEEQDW